MKNEERDAYVNRVLELFYEMYQPHSYRHVGGYEDEETGKYVVVFQPVSIWRRHIKIKVFLNEKGRLMPLFAIKKSSNQTELASASQISS